jgi:tetratricopeptide (TPR) repeat protein
MDYAVSLYHSPWTGDFSFHRNEALAYAIADYDQDDVMWLIIDPDESLVAPEVGFKEMRKRLTKLPDEVAALAVAVNEVNNADERTGSWRGIRFFRKSANLRYKNIIHNRPSIDGQAAMSNIELNHYGYSHNKDKLREKWLRTNESLKADIKEDPDSFRTCFYLCKNSLSLRRYEEGIFWGIRCLIKFPYPDDPDELQFYGSLYYAIGMAYARIQNAEEGWRWLDHGLKQFPDDIDLNFAMTTVAVKCVERDIFFKHAEKYLELLEEYRNPEKFDVFAKSVDPADLIERNVHHITNECEANVRGWMQNWQDIEELAEQDPWGDLQEISDEEFKARYPNFLALLDHRFQRPPPSLLAPEQYV